MEIECFHFSTCLIAIHYQSLLFNSHLHLTGFQLVTVQPLPQKEEYLTFLLGAETKWKFVNFIQ